LIGVITNNEAKSTMDAKKLNIFLLLLIKGCLTFKIKFSAGCFAFR